MEELQGMGGDRRVGCDMPAAAMNHLQDQRWPSGDQRVLPSSTSMVQYPTASDECEGRLRTELPTFHPRCGCLRMQKCPYLVASPSAHDLIIPMNHNVIDSNDKISPSKTFHEHLLHMTMMCLSISKRLIEQLEQIVRIRSFSIIWCWGFMVLDQIRRSI